MSNSRVWIGAFVKELEAALNRKDGYIMGSYGQNPRTGYLDLNVPESKCKSSWKPTGWYFNQYSGSQKEAALKWRRQCTRVWDCNGMAEGIYEILTGININSKARYNYRDWCGEKGTGLIPADRRIPGAAVFWSNSGASSIHHVGYLYKPVDHDNPRGDWWIIEARGVKYGVVMTKLKSRRPNFWGYMDKYFDYSESSNSDVMLRCPYPEPKKDYIRRGDEGDDVRWVQWHLQKWNGELLRKYGIDGEFGNETANAVKVFKAENGVGTPTNSNVGPLTKAALKRFE